MHVEQIKQFCRQEITQLVNTIGHGTQFIPDRNEILSKYLPIKDLARVDFSVIHGKKFWKLFEEKASEAGKHVLEGILETIDPRQLQNMEIGPLVEGLLMGLWLGFIPGKALAIGGLVLQTAPVIWNIYQALQATDKGIAAQEWRETGHVLAPLFLGLAIGGGIRTIKHLKSSPRPLVEVPVHGAGSIVGSGTIATNTLRGCTAIAITGQVVGKGSVTHLSHFPPFMFRRHQSSVTEFTGSNTFRGTVRVLIVMSKKRKENLAAWQIYFTEKFGPKTKFVFHEYIEPRKRGITESLTLEIGNRWRKIAYATFSETGHF